MSLMLTPEFLSRFKRATESKWAKGPLDGSPAVQFAAGTRWLPGLSPAQIDAYEKELNVLLPTDLRVFLEHMNGTDRGALNTFPGWVGAQGAGPAYSYPRDMNLVRALMDEWMIDWPEVVEVHSFHPEDRCVPIFEHHGVLCQRDRGASKVLSLMGDDVIVYEEDLRSYLEVAFLKGR